MRCNREHPGSVIAVIPHPIHNTQWSAEEKSKASVKSVLHTLRNTNSKWSVFFFFFFMMGNKY